MRRFVFAVWLVLGIGAVPGVSGGAVAEAQELSIAQGGTRGPRFFMAAGRSDSVVPVDASKVVALHRRITLDIASAPLGKVLEAIAREAGLRLNYSASLLPVDLPVSIQARNLTVAAVLTDVLLDAEVDVVVMTNGQVTLRKRARQQAGAVQGRVTDAATGQPLAGAEVRVVDTPVASVTNDSGAYALRNVPAGTQRVAARRIGYQAQAATVTIPDGGTASVDFALSAATTRLDDIVTTVTGEQRRLELGSSIVSLRADSLMQTAPVLSFGDLLQGRAPGVFSMTTSNNVGQAGTIRIRGLNSFSVPNDPIVVVDGVRIEAGPGTHAGAATNVGAGGVSGRLADLDPSEIASVEIVKGPSAATLYGTDAANGVLVITTKRGQPGRARVTAFTEQGVLEQRLDDWDSPYGGAPSYAFGHDIATGAPVRCTLPLRAAGACALDSLVTFNAFTDPDTRPFKNGRREQYGLQFSGGTTGGTTYFLSGDYEKETGTQAMPPADLAYLLAQRGVSELPDWQLRPNAYQKVNLRANVTAPLGRRGSVTVATGFVSNQTRQPYSPVFYQTGYRDVNGGWSSQYNRPAGTYSFHQEDVVRRFIGSINAVYPALDWLVLRGTVGADLSANTYGRLARRGDITPTDAGSRTTNELNVTRYSLDLGATATQALSRALSSKSSIGAQYNRRSQRGTEIGASNLPLGGETIAGAGNPLSASEITLATAVAGGYVEEMLGLRDRLFLTGAVRLDGGSAFGKDLSVAVYPKASLSWVVTDGQSGVRLPGVSSLRLRAAYGASGVQPGPFDALQRIQVITGVNEGTSAPGAALGNFGNPDLKPERTSEIETGLDLELAAGRVRLELTGYQRTSRDALVNRQLALSAGGGSRWENLGSVRNRGLELLLSADVLRGRVLSAGLTLTGSVNQNRLLSLNDNVIIGSSTGEGYQQRVGYPVQGIWGRTVASVNDANGNGIVEPTEYTLTDNHYIGPGFPTREATAAPYVGLFGERLRLGGLVQYRGGFYATGGASWVSCLSFVSGACRAMNDIGTPLIDQARALAYTTTFSQGVGTEPASYLTLRELSASLALPPAWGRAVGARDARLTLAARNVALLWRQGRVAAPENNFMSSDQVGTSTGGGPASYWLLRVNLNY